MYWFEAPRSAIIEMACPMRRQRWSETSLSIDVKCLRRSAATRGDEIIPVTLILADPLV